MKCEGGYPRSVRIDKSEPLHMRGICQSPRELTIRITFHASEKGVTMQRLSFNFPADTRTLPEIGKLAADAGGSAGFDDVEISDIQLAVDEACTNTITHGLKKDPTRSFQLAIQWKTGEIEILIYEKGEPFDPLQMKQPDLEAPLQDRQVGGLGFYFVKKLMDIVEYHVDKDGVKTLRMIKRTKIKP
ncbi:ATP-binding protein [Desulfococcaceae bacterium HSG8]|nr:ATP-binding protein [Desulfococcaceae bacterium HSG8]